MGDVGANHMSPGTESSAVVSTPLPLFNADINAAMQLQGRPKLSSNFRTPAWAMQKFSIAHAAASFPPSGPSLVDRPLESRAA